MEFCFIYDHWEMFYYLKCKKTKNKTKTIYYFQGENDSFAWIHAENVSRF